MEADTWPKTCLAPVLQQLWRLERRQVSITLHQHLPLHTTPFCTAVMHMGQWGSTDSSACRAAGRANRRHEAHCTPSPARMRLPADHIQ